MQGIDVSVDSLPNRIFEPAVPAVPAGWAGYGATLPPQHGAAHWTPPGASGTPASALHPALHGVQHDIQPLTSAALAQREAEKKRLKRVANRKSAYSSRARKKQHVEEMSNANKDMQQHAHILDLLPDLIVGVDRSGDISFVSQSVTRKLHYSAPQLWGGSILDLVTPESRHVLTAALRRHHIRQTASQRLAAGRHEEASEKSSGSDDGQGSNGSALDGSQHSGSADGSRERSAECGGGKRPRGSGAGQAAGAAGDAEEGASAEADDTFAVSMPAHGGTPSGFALKRGPSDGSSSGGGSTGDGGSGHLLSAASSDARTSAESKPSSGVRSQVDGLGLVGGQKGATGGESGESIASSNSGPASDGESTESHDPQESSDEGAAAAAGLRDGGDDAGEARDHRASRAGGADSGADPVDAGGSGGGRSGQKTFAAWSTVNLQRHNEEIDQQNEQAVWTLCLVRPDRTTLWCEANSNFSGQAQGAAEGGGGAQDGSSAPVAEVIFSLRPVRDGAPVPASFVLITEKKKTKKKKVDKVKSASSGNAPSSAATSAPASSSAATGSQKRAALKASGSGAKAKAAPKASGPSKRAAAKSKAVPSVSAAVPAEPWAAPSAAPRSDDRSAPQTDDWSAAETLLGLMGVLQGGSS
jgi:PAS domain-containing protein